MMSVQYFFSKRSRVQRGYFVYSFSFKYKYKRRGETRIKTSRRKNGVSVPPKLHCQNFVTSSKKKNK